MEKSGWSLVPQVVVVSNVVHHPAADALDIATVLTDYPVIVKRDEYKVGDLASYIPIDTIVPDNPDFHFLCPCEREKYEVDGEIKVRPGAPRFSVGNVPEKYRIIKAKNIRGVYSQGLLFPCPEGMQESDPVVEHLGLTKWEEIEEENIPWKGKGSKCSASEPPPTGWHIPHYDVVSVRQHLFCLREGEEIVLTEKIHGSNGAFVFDGERLWVKSRNLYKKLDPDDMWWSVAIRYDLEAKLRACPRLVFFGEVYGAIKGFRYDATVGHDGRVLPRLAVFDVWDLDALRFLDYDERTAKLTELGLPATPLLYRGPWLGKDAMYKLAEGPTLLGGGHVREGWVLVGAEGRYEVTLGKRLQLKLVGEGYNLQK